MPRKYHFPLKLPPASFVNKRQDGSMFSWCLFKILTQPSKWCNKIWGSSDQETFCNLILLHFHELMRTVPQFPVPSWQVLHLVWYSAAIVPLLQVSACCVFRWWHYSECLGCNQGIIELFLSAHTSLAILVSI